MSDKHSDDNVVAFPRPGYFSMEGLPEHVPLGESTFSTGWDELDRLFRFYHGQFVVTTGKPGHGKSTFLFNIVANIARLHGIRSFLYVPENERYLRDKLRKIWNDDERFQYFASQQVFVQSAMPEHYASDPHTLDWILDHAAFAVQHDHIELLIIDPWNEIEHAKPRDMLMTDYIGGCLRLIKQFCRHFRVVIVVVAHPTKAAADPDRLPLLSDIEGSMNWWNKSDNGLVVVREHESGTCRVISAKVREEPDAGKTGSCRFWVDPETGIFTPLVGAAGECEPPARPHRRDPRRD